MFRIGENEKSHVENIRVIKNGQEILLSHKKSKSLLIKN